MTRENKLALVVGFGLILFVGILISDHFSAAQNQDSARLADATTARNTSPVNRNLIDMVDPNQTAGAGVGGAGPGIPATVHVQTQDPRNSPGEVPGGQSAEGQGGASEADEPTISMPQYPPQPQSPTQVASGDVKVHQVARGETLFAIARKHYGDGSLWKPLLAFNKDRVVDVDSMRPGVTLRIPPRDVLTGESPVRSLNTPAPGRATPGTTPSKNPAADAPRSDEPIGVPMPFRAQGTEFASRNSDQQEPELVGTRGSVTKTVVRPVNGAPEAKPLKREEPKRSETRVASGDRSSSSPVRSGGGVKTTEYTVRAGDTMSKIAAKVTGSPARWQELYEMNRDVIADPHAVKPGTVLRVPASR